MTLTCCRHSAQERTSLVHTLIALKASDTSKVPTTGRPDQLSMVHESALSQCGPWCMRSWMNGRSQTSLPQLKNPMDWVSSLAYSMKPNGRLWLCLNPKDLNDAIKRDHHKTPTVEEITHQLGSTRFTKLDGTSSYLCIVLDYKSSLLMAFNTPWGWYRFVHLPFGLAYSQDIFQWMMDQILECCEGVIGITDNVVVHGKDDAEHDRHLHNLMQVACEHGLIFNWEKCDVKATSVTFFGTVYDRDRAHPDPKKVEAIHKMPPPEGPQELHKFLGMTTYLSPFIPSLSTLTAPLQGLLKKGTEFTWNNSYQDAFDTVKKMMVCMDMTFWYFDAHKPVIIQVDASQKGLGATLLQDGCPVAFASKALTPTEQHYANIECEMLACVFGAERFHTLCLWSSIHNWIWPQAAGADQPEEPCWCTCQASEDAVVFAELWHKDYLQTWQRDAGGRHPVTICANACTGYHPWPGNPPHAHHTREEDSFPAVYQRGPAPLFLGRNHRHRLARGH